MSQLLHRLIVLIVVSAATTVAVAADPPRLVLSAPVNGATEVSIDVGLLRLHFDRDMRTNSFTCWKSPQGAFPPMAKDSQPSWPDARTFELKLARLEPSKTYYVQLNAEGRQGFRAAADDAPLAITTIQFTTVAATPRQDIYTPESKPDTPRQDVYDPSQDQEQSQGQTGPRAYTLKWAAQAGQIHQMSQSIRLQLDLNLQAYGEQEQQKVDNLVKLRYTDEYLEVKNGRPTRLRRTIELAEVMTKDQSTNEVQRQPLPLNGMCLELSIQSDGSFQVTQVVKGDAQMARELAADSVWFEFEPDHAVSVGQSWELTGSQLATALSALDMTEGEFALHLEKVEQDPRMHLDVAKIKGRVRGRMQLEAGLSAQLEGELKEDFVPELGLPFLRMLDAKLRIDETVTGNDGQRVHITGTGQVQAVEERSMMSGPATGQGQQSMPVERQQPTNTGPGAQRPQNDGTRTVAFRRMVEPNEQAFSLLVPSGWQTEGGIFRVNPVTTNMAAQAIEAKLNFVLKKDAVGTVLLHFLPKILYVDNRGMPRRRHVSTRQRHERHAGGVPGLSRRVPG